MVKYALRENLLTAETNEFMAQVVNRRSYSFEEVITLMIKRGSTLTRTDISAVLEMYSEVVGDLVGEGAAVNTPLVNSSLTISGVFKGATDMFDTTRHKVRVRFTPGTVLRQSVRNVKLEKTTGQRILPLIIEVKDIGSDTVNDVLTPGDIMIITGAYLKFDHDDDTQGVFLLGESGHELRCTSIAHNKPGHITAKIPPDIEEGQYLVEVRSRISGSSRVLKVLKKGQFDKPLTVNRF